MSRIFWKTVTEEELNKKGVLHGGHLLMWLDAEAYTCAVSIYNPKNWLTKVFGEVIWSSPADLGDRLKLEFHVVSIGKTSLTLRAEIYNHTKKVPVATQQKLVLVNVVDGHPEPHGINK